MNRVTFFLMFVVSSYCFGMQNEPSKGKRRFTAPAILLHNTAVDDLVCLVCKKIPNDSHCPSPGAVAIDKDCYRLIKNKAHLLFTYIHLQTHRVHNFNAQKAQKLVFQALDKDMNQEELKSIQAGKGGVFPITIKDYLAIYGVQKLVDKFNTVGQRTVDAYINDCKKQNEHRRQNSGLRQEI